MIDYAKVASLLEEIAKDLRNPQMSPVERVYGAPLEALPVPAGFEKGEFRITKPGDWFLSRSSRKATMAKAEVVDRVGIPRIILRPVWGTAESAYGRPLSELKIPEGYIAGDMEEIGPKNGPEALFLAATHELGTPRICSPEDLALLRTHWRLRLHRKPSPEPEKAEEAKSQEPGRRAHDAWFEALRPAPTPMRTTDKNWAISSQWARSAWEFLEAYMPRWYDPSKKYVAFEVGEKRKVHLGDCFISGNGTVEQWGVNTPSLREYNILHVVHKPEEM